MAVMDDERSDAQRAFLDGEAEKHGVRVIVFH
jgi:hypothetical protein